MANIFRDGFDTYANATAAGVDITAKWSSSTNVSLQTGRFSGRCVRVGNGTMNAAMDSAASSLCFTCGWRNNVGGSSTAQRSHIRFLSAGTYMVGIMASNLGEVIAYRQTGSTAGTELGRSSTGIISSNVWYTVECEIVISDTVGRVTVWVDSVQVLNLTSVDTRNGSPTTVDTVELSGTGTNIDCDDLWIIDAASRPTDVLRCETLYCDSDGSTLNFTPSTGSDHFAVVDESQASTTDYLSASNVGDVDELGLGALSTTPTSIAGVCVVGFLQKTDATARSMALGVKSGATTSDGSNYSLNSTGRRHERLLTTDPNTSAAWAVADVNLLQVRPKVTV